MDPIEEKRVAGLVKRNFPDCVSFFTVEHPFTRKEKAFLILESIDISDNQGIADIINSADTIDFLLRDELRLWPYNESPLVLQYYLENTRLILGEDISDIVEKNLRVHDYYDSSFSNLVQTLIHLRKYYSAYLDPDTGRLRRMRSQMLRALIFGCSSIPDVMSIDDVKDFLKSAFRFDLDAFLRTIGLPNQDDLDDKTLNRNIEDILLFVEAFFREIQRRRYPVKTSYDLVEDTQVIRLDNQFYDRALQKTLRVLKLGVQAGLLSSVNIHGSAVTSSLVPGWSDLDVGVVLHEDSVMDRERLVDSFRYIKSAYKSLKDELAPLNVWQHTFDVNSAAELPYLDQWYWHSMKQETATLAGMDYLSNVPNLMKLDKDYIRAKWTSTLWDFRKTIAQWDEIDVRTRSRFFAILMNRPMSALFCLGHTVTNRESLDVFESCFGPSLTEKMYKLRKIREEWPKIRDNYPLLREYAHSGLDFNAELREKIFSEN